MSIAKRWNHSIALSIKPPSFMKLHSCFPEKLLHFSWSLRLRPYRNVTMFGSYIHKLESGCRFNLWQGVVKLTGVRLQLVSLL